MEPRRRLADLIRCDVVSFFGLDSGRQVQRFGQDWPTEPEDVDPHVFWGHYWSSDPAVTLTAVGICAAWQ
jgi:hypothetical protein